MSDEVLDVGGARELVAILSRPCGTPRVGVVILNAGVLHRVGPHRLHVNLGRRLAARGFPTVRMDVGGVGDTPILEDAPSFQAGAVTDAATAMTAMTRTTGVERFVLFGLCSGADNGLATALADPRVVGMVTLDLPTYATRRSRLRKVAERIADAHDPTDVARWFAKQALRRLRPPTIDPHADPDDGQRREVMPREALGGQLTQLVDRGVALLSIYSGVHRERYNHADQVFEWFPALRGRIEHAYFPRANHSFTERAAQAALLDTITSWFERHYR